MINNAITYKVDKITIIKEMIEEEEKYNDLVAFIIEMYDIRQCQK